MATSISKNIDEIIDETEIMEKMLNIINVPHTPQKLQRNLNPTHPIVCSFCNKINHTWEACRTRISFESQRNNVNNRNNNYRRSNQEFTNKGTFNPNTMNRSYQPNYQLARNMEMKFSTTPQNIEHNPIKYERQQNINNSYSNTNYQNEPSYANERKPTVHFQPTNAVLEHNMRNPFYRRTDEEQNITQQYNTFCRYCKRSGHLINECRIKKFSDERNNNYYNGQNTKDLEEQFNNMKIYSISHQASNQQRCEREAIQEAENSNGSD